MATTGERSKFDTDAMRKHLGVLKLPFMLEHHQALAQVSMVSFRDGDLRFFDQDTRWTV